MPTSTDFGTFTEQVEEGIISLIPIFLRRVGLPMNDANINLVEEMMTEAVLLTIAKLQDLCGQ